MAKDKKGFVLYADLIHTVEKLPDDKAGILLKHLLRYVNDLEPVLDDLLVELTFEPIKQQLKRDLKHWETVRQKRSEAGKASALKRQQVSTSVESVQQKSTNSTVIVKDTVTVKVKEKVKDIYRSFDHLSISIDEKDKLISLGYSIIQIDSVLDRIANWKKNTSYKSLYLTSLNWLKKEYPNVKPEEFKLSNYKIPNSDLFGYPENKLIEKCKAGDYQLEDKD